MNNLLSFDNFRRRDVAVSFRPTLTQADWNRLQEVVARHEQLACNLPGYGTEDRDYWISFLSKGGGWPECKSTLFMLFHPTADDSNPVLYRFERLPDEEDWRWFGGETYDELSAEEFVAISNKRRI